MASRSEALSGVYRERGQRLVEKEEARMLREALQAVDMKEEARLHSAAQDEASELVWKHQNPEASQRSSDAPYLYKQPSCNGGHVRNQSDNQTITTDSAKKDLGWITRPAGDHNRPGSMDTSQQSILPRAHGDKEEDLDGHRDQHMKGHDSWDSPEKKAYMNMTFSLPQVKPYGRRRSSGSKTRPPSGSLFRNPNDKIYEEPEEMKQGVDTLKLSQTAHTVPLRSTTQNPIAKTQTAVRSLTDPAESKGKHSDTEIYRNPPSQSRNPSYLQNKAPPTPPEPAVDDEPQSMKTATKNGIEIRSDDIRAATSMRLKDRSPRLPSPTVVSNAKGRPIVSFDKDWTPSEGDLQRQESFPQRPTDQGPSHHLLTKVRPKPALPQSTASAPVIPTINVSEPSSIQIDEPPSVPSTNVPVVPSISVSTADTSTATDSKEPKLSRPLPTPSERSLARPSGRPLPHHSSTAPVRTSLPHWSPSQRRATAQCAACALPISGRIVSAAAQRFHPECFTCFHCSEQLECVAFYPEPETFRDDRVTRIRARNEGIDVPDEVGKTWEDDGDESMRFYCHLDFHEKFSPRCRSCKTPIEGEVVVACGGPHGLDAVMPRVQDDTTLHKIVDYSTIPSPVRDVDSALLPLTGRKRKYHEAENTAGNWEPFRISRYPDNATADIAVLKPRLLLPRSYLPLAFLDATRANGFEEETRLFSAHVPALENTIAQEKPYKTPYILIAERNGKSMSAIERVQPGIYAQCRLGNWVTIRHLNGLQLPETPAAAPVKEPRFHGTEKWWRSLVADEKGDMPPPSKSRTQLSRKKVCLNLEKPQYVRREAALPIKEVPLVMPERPPSATGANLEGAPIETLPQLAVEQTFQEPDNLLRSVKAQYMESLYKSRASLAYFAKGPLSRARAAFSNNDDLNASRHRLVEYLQDLVVPLSILDKKYRETLPRLVAEFPDLNVSGDERTEVVARFRKSCRRSKKEKTRKNGLYPQEEVDVLQWWLDCLISTPACESTELRAEATKASFLEQRIRETQLQIILLLEILALGTTLPIPSVKTVAEELAEGELPHKQRKLKKRRDLSLLLDLFVDRLCIWQSTTAEEDNTSKKSESAESTPGEVLRSNKQESNQLRDFCVDVVLPFYSARLPEVCRTLCKKLGGPLPHSPARPALKRAASSGLKPPKPGAAVKRAQPRQARRTLERVLTDDMRSQRHTPTLSRSATDSILPNLKREPSETALNALPAKKATLHESKRYSQREVDLRAVSQAAEAKIRKKANVEEELRGAIAALKRPNPRMAVKEFVEAAERRAAGAKSRKSKNPVWNPLAQSVQVMATPSANRRKDVFATLPSQVPTSAIMPQELEEIPPSSCTRVPASAIKPPTERIVDSNPRPKKRLMPTGDQTPTRGPSKHSNLNIAATPRLGLEGKKVYITNQSSINSRLPPSILDSSKSVSEELPPPASGVQGTPSRRRSASRTGILPRAGVEGIPLKPLESVSGNLMPTSNNVTPSPLSNEGGVSIYKSLGWDDDVDELV
ncbi:MAG: hypothetical protein Q9181_000224 [Wetmoreana brouardii]